MTGGAVCAAHGGRARQVRQAAAVRMVEARMHREMERGEEWLHEARTRWWIDRIVYAAEVLDVDPLDLAAEVKKRGWMISAVWVEWPAGMAADDEPKIEDFFDARRARRRVS